MGSPLPDAGWYDTENTGQWTLLPWHEQAQHLTPGMSRALLRIGSMPLFGMGWALKATQSI
jgi:hypothetical protein